MRNRNQKEIIKYSKEYKKKMKITKEIRELIEGLLLGDVSVQKRYKNSDAVLRFCQSERNADYLYHLYDIFKDYVATPPRREELRRRGKVYNQLTFQTLSFKLFNEYKERYYNNEGKKVIPEDIKERLSERGLAYWFMDDGAKAGKGYMLHTDNFDIKEVEKLKEVLGSKYGIYSTLRERHKGQYAIYIRVRSSERFKEIVNPYVYGSMRRKIE